MRVNLSTQPFHQMTSRGGRIPLTLTIRPARGFPGEYQRPIDGEVLLQMLRQQTDLPGYVLEAFARQLRTAISARLPGVDLSENVLTEIGYFTE